MEGHEREVLEGARGFFEKQKVKAVYLDGYHDSSIPEFLRLEKFRLFNGRSMEPWDFESRNLLAVREDVLGRERIVRPYPKSY